MKEILLTALIYAAVAIFGYFMGCFSLSYLLAKKRGFDIRTRGSNNAGASNAAVTMGWKIGVLVGFCDIMKCFIAVLVVRLLVSDYDPYSLVTFITGVACVLGHMHPFYMRFRGGKGFASYLGMILAIDWRFFLVLIAAILVVALLSDYIVMGTLITMVSFPFYSFFSRHSLIAALIPGLLSLLILFRHRNNFSDIINGRERRISAVFKKKTPEKE